MIKRKDENMKFKTYATMALLFLVGVFFVGNNNVHAEKYTGQAIWPSEHIDNIYIKKVRSDGTGKYQQARFIRRSEDNKFVYCLQPFADINNNYVYNVTRQDYETILGLSKEQWKRASLLAYYGYGYNQDGYNHSEKKWYVISQVLIWRTVEPNADIYFTNTLNGTRNDSLFVNEIAELESLVANHKTTPSFDLGNHTMTIDSILNLNDNNGVLSKYDISSSNNLSVSKSGNTLSIKANSIGNGSITFTKHSNLYDSDPVLYYTDGSQNVFRVGNLDPVTSLINIKIIGGKVTIHKLDRDSGSSTASGDATLEGAKYGIFDSNGNQIETLITNADGTVQSGNLPYLGKYTIRELLASKGYELDKTEYSFEISENDLYPNVTVYEQVIRKQIIIRKYYANGETGKLNPEENIIFKFYDKRGKEVASVKTDKDGYAILNLPYGTYTGKQITTSKGHEKVDDFEVTIDENSPEVIKLSFTNAPIKARLKVVKIDAETKKVIARSKIKFKIFDIDRNEYVCQTIAYPNAKTICEYETDENGMFYSPFELKTGRYRLEEIDQKLDGYLWNKESKEFVIDENSDFNTDNELGVIFEVQFENKQVKGKVEIKKNGETLVIKDGYYKYEKMPLANTEFEIKAAEDIIIGGKQYYKKGDVVAVIKTDENGIASLDNLPLGKYILSEKKTNENLVLDKKEYLFELKYQDQYTETIIQKFEFDNQYKKGTLDFKKTDLTTGKEIPNTKVEIYYIDKDNNRKLVFTGITDENGNIKISDLFVGKFVIVETDAATGYRLSDEKVIFEIKENGEIVKAEMTNEKIKSTIKIHKVDENGNPLQGVKIGIYDLDNNLIYSGITDENGDIEVELEYGSYYFQEIETIDGYILSDEKVYFDVNSDGEIIQKTLVNEIKEIEVPNTLSDSYTNIIAGVIVLAGASLIVISSKKKKK
jgi:uncharacterized surface anchored protein